MKMTKFICLSALAILAASSSVFTQSKDSLRKQIEQIVSTKKALVGVAIVGGDGKDEIVINGERRYPMQSGFRYHIGLVMLAENDKGKFTLDQQVEIMKDQMLPGMRSTLREENQKSRSVALPNFNDYAIS